MYLTQNKGKSAATKRFRTWTLNNKIYKYITSVSKNVYIDKLDDIQEIQQQISKHNQNEACWCKVKHIYWL